MSDKQSQPNQNSPDVPEWFRKERPVILGELYFLEDRRCKVERAGRDADVDLVVQLKEDTRDASVGVIVRGDILPEEYDEDNPPQRRSLALSSLQLPHSTCRKRPVIVLFFDMTTDEGYGQILPVNELFSADAAEGDMTFINLRNFQPSYLISTALGRSSEPELDPVALPPVEFLRATTLNRKGTLLLSRGNYHEALSIFERALDSINGAQYPKLVALTLSNLAQVHHALGDLFKADNLYDEALSLMADVETRASESQPSADPHSTLLDL